MRPALAILALLLGTPASAGEPLSAKSEPLSSGGEPLQLAQSREVPSIAPPDADEPTIIPPDEIPTLDNPHTAREGGSAAAREADDEPQVLRDPSLLPEPARRMRELILEAARSGDIERLRPLLGIGDTQTQLAFDELETDPIEFLKAASGDADGYEILGILVEIMEAGFVKVEEPEGSLYVWPYFFAYPIKDLTPPQKVELFGLLTGGDWEDMKDFGAYIFYRLAITPEGEWKFFLSGDA